MPLKRRKQKKQIQINRARKILRKRARRNKWIKLQNFEKNGRTRVKQRRPRGNNYNRSPIQKTINVPRNFNLLSGRDEVLSFFRYCKKFNSNVCDKLHFNFDD